MSKVKFGDIRAALRAAGHKSVDNVFAANKIPASADDYFVNVESGAVYLKNDPSYTMVSNSSGGYSFYSSRNGNGYISRDMLRDVIKAYKNLASKNVETDAPAKGTKIASEKYIIGTVVGDSVVLSKAPKLHDNHTSAKIEASRLAKLEPGTKFAVLKVVNTVVAGGLVWE